MFVFPFEYSTSSLLYIIYIYLYILFERPPTFVVIFLAQQLLFFQKFGNSHRLVYIQLHIEGRQRRTCVCVWWNWKGKQVNPYAHAYLCNGKEREAGQKIQWTHRCIHPCTKIWDLLYISLCFVCLIFDLSRSTGRVFSITLYTSCQDHLFKLIFLIDQLFLTTTTTRSALECL